MVDTDIRTENARRQWAEGDRRVWRQRGDTVKFPVLERVIEEIQDEVVRRIGQTFTLQDLLLAYDSSEQWATQVAHETAPGRPWAWEMSVVCDAAFHRLVSSAQDYMQ